MRFCSLNFTQCICQLSHVSETLDLNSELQLCVLGREARHDGGEEGILSEGLMVGAPVIELSRVAKT